MRRLVQRRMQGDDGSTLVETVVALVVFALIMSGLAASMAVFARSTALTKARSAATSLGQKQVETARSLGTKSLSVCTGGGSPEKYSFKGILYPVLTTSNVGCLPHQATTSSGGYTFTVKQYVLIPPSPVQPTALIQTKTNTVGVPQTQKLLVVKLSWTAPTAGSYELDTIMNNNDAVTASPAQGVRMNVNDQTGALINISADIWDYTVRDSGNTVITSGTTEDGTTGVLSLNPGTFTCTLTAETDAGQSYSPGTNAGMTVDVAHDVISGPCTVTANSVTDWNTSWSELSACVPTTTKGTLKVTVKNSAGGVVPGAAVALTNVNGNSGTPGPATSDATGVATFNGTVPGDLYTYTISATGFATSSGLGPVCVVANSVMSADGSISASSSCPVVNTKGSVSFTVKDENGNVIGGAKVVLTNQTPGKGSPGSVNTNATTGIAFFNNNVLGGSYKYTLTKNGYTSPGAQGPICIAATPTGNDFEGTLPTSGSTGCVSSSSKGTLTVAVKDQSGTGLNGAKVTLTNANGNGAPGAKTTTTVGGADGIALFSGNVVGDPYLIAITPPAGYSTPDPIGPVCVTAGGSVTQPVTLVGIMTSQIKITNSDLQPTKTYNVTVTDAAGIATTNSITINRGKNATVTFASIPTNNYTLKVCVPIAATANCDAINDPTAVYNWTGLGATYLTAVTDTKGGA